MQVHDQKNPRKLIESFIVAFCVALIEVFDAFRATKETPRSFDIQFGKFGSKTTEKCILSDMKKLLLAITYRCDLNLLQERPKRPCVLYQSCILEGSNYVSIDWIQQRGVRSVLWLVRIGSTKYS